MVRYRSSLPQLSGKTFLTDGGLETTMVFLKSVELPHFAAIDMLRTADGVEMLHAYYREYASIARDAGMGFVLETPTWRANRDWSGMLGCSEEEFAELNRRAVWLMAALRDEFETAATPMVISGCVGPRGDGYSPDSAMSAAEAAEYHSWQAKLFSGTAADMITAITMNYVGEAAGVTLAAKAAGLPCAISFTVETDGRLPTGEPLMDAIGAVDQITDGFPSYYMINCAHPTHFSDGLTGGEPWTDRIGGIRANASTKSHAELDECSVLDDGDPEAFGRQNAELATRFPMISVFGGCCGTDVRHIAAIVQAL
jgi:S-methylmethionine-dependent homocysteine/selenocysteine methylase